MATDLDSISSIAFQGVGLGILAGTTMKTMNIIEKGFSRGRRPKSIKSYTFEPKKLDLKRNKRYRIRY